MTPTHADKLAGALEAIEREVGTSTLAHKIAREALTEYRTRPQLPGAELVWMETDYGIEEAKGAAGFSYSIHDGEEFDGELGTFVLWICPGGASDDNSVYSEPTTEFDSLKEIASFHHNAILSAVSGGGDEIVKLQGMLKRATTAYYAHAPVNKIENEQATFDEIDDYLNSLVPAPPVLGGEVGL